jgi:hypothetical protein
VGADVDELLLDRCRFATLRLRHDVRRQTADHAAHRTARGVHEHRVSRQKLLVEPADRVDAEVAGLVDVRHDHADLIGVGHGEHTWTRLRAGVGPQVPQRVRARLGDPIEPPAQQGLHRTFEAARGGAKAQLT